MSSTFYSTVFTFFIFFVVALCSSGALALADTAVEAEKRAGGHNFRYTDEDLISNLLNNKRGGGRNFYQQDEKRGGARLFGLGENAKRGGARALQQESIQNEKRGGGRTFEFSDVGEKRGGGRTFGYLDVNDKRGGARAFQLVDSAEKRAGAHGFRPMIIDNISEKRAGARTFQQQLDKRGGARQFATNDADSSLEKRRYYGASDNFKDAYPSSAEKRGGARPFFGFKRGGARFFSSPYSSRSFYASHYFPFDKRGGGRYFSGFFGPASAYSGQNFLADSDFFTRRFYNNPDDESETSARARRSGARAFGAAPSWAYDLNEEESR